LQRCRGKILKRPPRSGRPGVDPLRQRTKN
jgi:hypothetical protein